MVTMTCPELDIDPQSQAIFIKNKTLSCYLFGGNIEKIETSYENKISKKTYRDVIRKVFTSDYFKSKYFKIIVNKTHDIEHEIIEMENKVVELQKSIIELRNTVLKLNNSQIRI